MPCALQAGGVRRNDHAASVIDPRRRLALLQAANAPINAFLAFDPDATDCGGSLSGLDVGVKANIMVQGLPYHAGIDAWRHRIAPGDADVVSTLRAAGARIVGIVNMDEAALGAKGDNVAFGAVHNPHRQGWSAGGSSCGSAAAVAAGLCDAALGTDTLGSARIPAAHCGTYAFMPAHGAVSAAGVVAADPAFDSVAVIARDMRVLEQLGRQGTIFCE